MIGQGVRLGSSSQVLGGVHRGVQLSSLSLLDLKGQTTHEICNVGHIYTRLSEDFKDKALPKTQPRRGLSGR